MWFALPRNRPMYQFCAVCNNLGSQSTTTESHLIYWNMVWYNIQVYSFLVEFTTTCQRPYQDICPSVMALRALKSLMALTALPGVSTHTHETTNYLSSYLRLVAPPVEGAMVSSVAAVVSGLGASWSSHQPVDYLPGLILTLALPCHYGSR